MISYFKKFKREIAASEVTITQIIKKVVFITPIPMLILAIIVFNQNEPSKGYLILGLILPVLFTYIILEFGYVKYAVLYSTMLIAGGTTFSCMFGQGIHDTGIVVYPILILFASLILDTKKLIIAGIFVAIALVWLTLGEAYEWYQLGQRKTGSISDSFILSMMCIMAMVITSLFGNKINLSINRTNKDLEKRKSIEAQLQDHSRERSELLREVHHRVKNNLAFTSSLVEIEMMEEHTSPEYLKSIQNKIISIARANDPLFQSEKYESVELSRYLHDLKEISFFPENVIINSETISINVDKAVPIGMIIHELILIIGEAQNSEVLINLTKNGADTCLNITSSQANMKQMYESMPLEKSLIEIMSEELGGHFNITDESCQLIY